MVGGVGVDAGAGVVIVAGEGFTHVHDRNRTKYDNRPSHRLGACWMLFGVFLYIVFVRSV